MITSRLLFRRLRCLPWTTMPPAPGDESSRLPVAILSCGYVSLRAACLQSLWRKPSSNMAGLLPMQAWRQLPKRRGASLPAAVQKIAASRLLRFLRPGESSQSFSSGTGGIFANGSFTVNIAPPPARFSAETLPPCTSAKPFTSDKPMPVPPAAAPGPR